MLIRKLISFLFVGMILSSCTTPELEIINTNIEKPKLELEMPPPIEMGDIKWFVLTEDNIDDILRELETSNNNVVLFALTENGYEVLAKNQLQIRNYLRQLQDMLNAYKKYYEQE